MLPAVAEKLALKEPAGTLIELGTRSALLLLEERATVLLWGAVLFTVTVQVLVAPNAKLVGLHCRDESARDGASVREAVMEVLPSVAVTTAVCVLVTVPAVALKVALVAPAAILTEAGIESRELLSPSATAVPVAAASFNVAAHVLVAPEIRLVGLQLKEISVSGSNSVRDTVWELLPSVALTAAVWVALTALAPAKNVALVEPAETVTDAGTVTLELLSPSATLVFEGAA
jgi:hypothetical protein